MTKYINGRKLSKTCNESSKSFSGATLDDMQDYIKPTLNKKPDKIIIHAGTNNIKSYSPKAIEKKLGNLVKRVKKELPNADIALSSVIYREDDKSLNSKIKQVNCLLETFCEQSDFDYINNDNIHADCLNAGGLHLNRKGTITLASNFRNYLKYWYDVVNADFVSNEISSCFESHTEIALSKTRGFKIGSININSLLKHIDDLQVLVVFPRLDNISLLVLTTLFCRKRHKISKISRF